MYLQFILLYYNNYFFYFFAFIYISKEVSLLSDDDIIFEESTLANTHPHDLDGELFSKRYSHEYSLVDVDRVQVGCSTQQKDSKDRTSIAVLDTSSFPIACAKAPSVEDMTSLILSSDSSFTSVFTKSYDSDNTGIFLKDSFIQIYDAIGNSNSNTNNTTTTSTTPNNSNSYVDNFQNLLNSLVERNSKSSTSADTDYGYESQYEGFDIDNVNYNNKDNIINENINDSSALISRKISFTNVDYGWLIMKELP